MPAMAAAASSPQWKLYYNPHFLSESLQNSISSAMGDLALALAENVKLRAELDLERRMRSAAEFMARSAARELTEERRSRADDRRRFKTKLADAATALEERMREVAEIRMPRSGEADKGRDMQAREALNPHIKRGIKGFVEFSRAFRARSLGSGRERSGNDLECQRAQLRVLLKQKNNANPTNLGTTAVG